MLRIDMVKDQTDEEFQQELEATRMYCETCEEEIDPNKDEYYEILHRNIEPKERIADCLCSQECLAQYP